MAVNVKYVGKKQDGTHDSESGSGVVWKEPGDVQPVPDKAWDKLKRYPDVWELVPDAGLGLAAALPAAPPAPTPAPAPAPDTPPADSGAGQGPGGEGDAPQYVIQVGDQKVPLDALDKDALQQLAKDLEMKVHHAAGVEKLRQALLEAHPVPADA